MTQDLTPERAVGKRVKGLRRGCWQSFWTVEGGRKSGQRKKPAVERPTKKSLRVTFPRGSFLG